MPLLKHSISSIEKRP
ncbi:uncharacterized protein FFB14_06710 [Fusarium fujikuroi]|nr:uncharacterized protein FFB14_06710 [Fusarium fujikuroi]